MDEKVTDWRLIEQDIETLERTGCWPAGDPPAWAQKFIDDFPIKIHAADASIINYGLREIIRQLKQQFNLSIAEALNSNDGTYRP